MRDAKDSANGLRFDELYEYPKYLINGGQISPLSLLGNVIPNPPPCPHSNKHFSISNEVNSATDEEIKEEDKEDLLARVQSHLKDASREEINRFK